MIKKTASWSTLKKLRKFYGEVTQGQPKEGQPGLSKKGSLTTSEMESSTGSTEIPLNELLVIPTENKITVVIQGKIYFAKVSKQVMIRKAQEFLTRGILSNEYADKGYKWEKD